VSLTPQLPPHLPCAIHLVIRVPDAPNRRAERLVPVRTRRSRRSIGVPGLVQEIRRRSDWQDRTDRLDSVGIPVLIDEGDHHFARRSSSACAKYADAFLKISFARRNSTFSRSSC